MELPSNTVVLSLSDYESMRDQIKELLKVTEDRNVMIVTKYHYHGGYGMGSGPEHHVHKKYESKDSVINELNIILQASNKEIKRLLKILSDNEAMYNLERGMKDMRIAELERRKWWQIWK
jgi:hypothetical protein